MELSPSKDAASYVSSQEIPSILWNTKVHHRVLKRPPLIPIPSQINLVHTPRPIATRSILTRLLSIKFRDCFENECVKNEGHNTRL
jgi:hypothetical protein